MTPTQFVYWLQGFFELTGTTSVTEEQSAMIKEHLNLVFEKETKPLKQQLPLIIDFEPFDEERYGEQYIKRKNPIAGFDNLDISNFDINGTYFC